MVPQSAQWPNTSSSRGSSTSSAQTSTVSHVEKIKHYLLSKNARNDMKALAELIKNDTAFV